MHICALLKWTNFRMQACSGLQNLCTQNAHFLAPFFIGGAVKINSCKHLWKYQKRFFFLLNF